MIKKHLVLVFGMCLIGCYEPKINDTSSENDTKESQNSFVSCSYPNTPYEAFIEAGYYPEEELKKVEVLLVQEERIASVKLFKQNIGTYYWFRSFNLFEFDCNQYYETYFLETFP